MASRSPQIGVLNLVDLPQSGVIWRDPDHPDQPDLVDLGDLAGIQITQIGGLNLVDLGDVGAMRATQINQIGLANIFSKVCLNDVYQLFNYF